jgi:hypothetical protein
MLVVTRYRVDAGDASSFLRGVESALGVLASRPGWRTGQVGRAVDDPTLWILSGEWDDVGSYRRALSTPEAKLAVMSLPGEVLDEPTAFEVFTDFDGSVSALAADAGIVGVGEAAAPVVPTDFDRP